MIGLLAFVVYRTNTSGRFVRRCPTVDSHEWWVRVKEEGEEEVGLL